jgi:class 3 adenylate cyclase/tetratricopeptide (TPR) repeat protein
LTPPPRFTPRMENPIAYIPVDRRLALADSRELPERTRGAALFADISGFTPLTEMLARTLGPKRGAEELTRYLNLVYDALIAELHRFGGSVLAFSGDAITCWFDRFTNDPRTEDPGAMPVLRAAAAALAMQVVMVQFKDLELTGGGRVSLAMKAAVAAGPVRRFMVGDPQYAFLDVMAGETLDAVAAAEHHAEKGEVVLDSDALEILAGRVQIAARRSDPDSGEQFAVVASLSMEVPEQRWPALDASRLGPEQTRPWLIPAVYRLLQAGQGEFLAELRPGAVLFVHFSGIDYERDPGAPARLDAFIRQVQRVLARFDGSLLQVTIGDKGSYLYAVFGAPIAHEDDVDRAASAALEMQELPAQLEYLQPLKIGVTFGRLRVGAYGGIARRTYGVLGDPVNLSARLMQAALPGQILADGEAHGRAGAAFVWDELPPVRVKGKSEPVEVYRLVRVRHRRVAVSLEARYPYPPVGRQDVQAGLGALLERLVAGQKQIVRLVGPAGTGKSHLGAEFIRHAREMGVEVVTGVCQSILRAAAYAPWRQVFSTLFDLDDTSEVDAVEKLGAYIEREHPDWTLRLPLLGDLLRLTIPDNPTTAAMDSTLRRDSLFNLLVEVVQFWTRSRPLLILLDNAQWMDEASQDLARTLAEQVDIQSPLMVFLAYRPAAPGEDPLLHSLGELPQASAFTLGAMDRAEMAAVAERFLGAPATPLLLEIVNSTARGNPFYAGELLGAMQEGSQVRRMEDGHWGVAEDLFNALRRADFLAQAESQWYLKEAADLSAVKLGIPDSIHGLVLSRLDRLPEAHKLTLKVSSVLGYIVDLFLVKQAHPEQKDLADIQAEAARMEMEEVLLVEDLEENIYTFVHHTTQEVAYDTLLFTQRRQLHEAVARALAEHQPGAVIQIAHHAYAGEAWELSMRFNLLAGERAKQLHATQQGIDFLQKALESAGRLPEAGTAGERLRIHLSLGELYVSTGEYEKLGAHLDPALGLADSLGDREAQAQACRWYGRAFEQRGEYTQAINWLERGFSALDGQASLEEAELSLLSGLIHIRQGNFEQAIELCQRSLKVAEVLDDVAVRARTYNLLGIIDLRGSGEAAIERFQESLHQYEQIGDVYGLATSHNLIANGYFAQGALSLADLHYRQSLDQFTQIGHIYNQVLVNNNLGGIAIKQGRYEAALGYYQRAVRQLEQIQGSLWVFGALHLNIGNTLIQQAELGRAQDELDLALDFLERAQIKDLLPELYGLFAELHCRAADLEQAERYGQQSLELARELEMPREEGHNLRIMGEIARSRADLDQAQALFEASHRLLSDAGDEYEGARTRLAQAQLLADRGEISSAREALKECQAVFERLEAQHDLERLRELQGELNRLAHL